MLKVTLGARAAGGTRLILEGRLTGPWVAELQSAVTLASSAPGRVHLDLSSVQFVDNEGLGLLLDLMDHGVVLEKKSPFVEELLKPNGG